MALRTSLLILTAVISPALAGRLPSSHPLWVRGGDSFGVACDEAVRAALAAAEPEIAKFAEEVESGSCVAEFGAKCDALCELALSTFTSKAPAAKSPDEESATGEKVKSLAKGLDNPLQVIYMKQLLLLREKSLKQYKSASKNSESSDYEAMIAADAFFGEAAEASTRKGSGAWDFAAERLSLQSTMNEAARSKKRLADTKLAAAKAQNEIMKVLQMQHSQIQQLQGVAYGQASPLNVGLAYRVPDTNINLSLGHQQGRTNVQLSCVPDESAPMLGPNGFTRGVGPGNLGVSVNLNV